MRLSLFRKALLSSNTRLLSEVPLSSNVSSLLNINISLIWNGEVWNWTCRLASIELDL